MREKERERERDSEHPLGECFSLNWSWKDRIVGGRLNLEGSELSLNKAFRLFETQSIVNLKASYDIHSQKKLVALEVKPFQVRRSVFLRTLRPFIARTSEPVCDWNGRSGYVRQEESAGL